MIVRTEDLKEVISKSLKGAGCNTFIPITCMCRIFEMSNKLFISTTDGISYLTVCCDTQEDVKSVPVDAVVDFMSVANLIMKFTSDTTHIHATNDTLFIEANGKYKIEVKTDDDGSRIIFPDAPEVHCDDSDKETIYADNIKDIIRTNKSSVPKAKDCRELCGYMFDNGVITTDSLVICKNNSKVFNNRIMLSTTALDVLCLFDDCIDVTHSGNLYIFKDDTILYKTYISEYTDSFPIDAINSLLDTGFEHSFTIDKDVLYDALDRVALFISPYDANACNIEISNNHVITISNSLNTGVEKLGVIDCIIDDNYNIVINAQFLMSQLKSMQDTITFAFGNETCIGLFDELTTRIIAVQEARYE